MQTKFVFNREKKEKKTPSLDAAEADPRPRVGVVPTRSHSFIVLKSEKVHNNLLLEVAGKLQCSHGRRQSVRVLSTRVVSQLPLSLSATHAPAPHCKPGPEALPEPGMFLLYPKPVVT